jgi:acyl-CoA dehydrogenase
MGSTMDSDLAEELSLFRASVRRFLEKEVVPHRDRWRREGMVDRTLWNKAGEQGLLLAGISDAYGGGGGSFHHEVVIIEELGRIAFLDFAVAMHSAIVAPYVLHCGTEEQRQRFLPKLASGAYVGALAMTEPGAGSDVQAIRTHARREGDHFILNGSKIFITNGWHANFILVACKTDPNERAKGTSLLALETDLEDGTPIGGFRRGRRLEKIGFKASDTAELFFDEVKIPAENLIGGTPGQGFVQMMQQLPQERLLVGVQALAAMEAAIAETLAYVKERKAFGKSVMEFQNTKFRLAEAVTETRIARVFIERCIEDLLAGKLDPVTGAMVKYWTSDKQGEVIDSCLQLFGGYGYMAEYPISHMWTDARVQRIYGGTNEIMKEVISRSL